MVNTEPQPVVDIAETAQRMALPKEKSLLKKNWLSQAIEQAGFHGEEEARSFVVASGKEVDIVCPPRKEGYTRLIHRTSPQMAERIAVLGLDYSTQGMISSTATTEDVSLSTSDPRFRLLSAVVMDIPISEIRKHNDPTRSTGLVEATNITGVVHIGESRVRISRLPMEARAALLLPQTGEINPDSDLGRQYVQQLVTAVNTGEIEDFPVGNQQGQWLIDTLGTLGYDIQTEIDGKTGLIHMISFKQKDFPIEPPTEDQKKQWRIEAIEDSFKQRNSSQETGFTEKRPYYAPVDTPGTGSQADSQADVW